MKRLMTFKSILWTIVGLAMASGITRMLFGLGAITNQSDATPWGIWKGINVVPGIALAAGGFVVTAIIYVMRRHEFSRYSKFAVLLAFLGYISAATSLVVELGLPWLVWHPVIYWQPHSALFEVSWCVILYLTVLFLEFVPVPLDETHWFSGVRRFLIKYKLILVVLGVMISTLHQSSLGTMFLLTPEKLHALWYSSMLPIMFFVSAVAIGPLMVILAVLVVSSLYGRELEREKLGMLGLISMGVLVVYGLIRIIDIAATGKLLLVFDGSWQANIFLLELVLILVLPIIFLAVKKLRYSTAGLWIATISGVLGMVLNRANIAGIMLVQTGNLYIPTIYEIFISVGIISAAILGFLFCVERFKLWETKWEDSRQEPNAQPEFDRSSEVYLGAPRLAGRTIYSMIFVVSLAFGFAVISSDRLYSHGVDDVIAQEARGNGILYIDGNRDNFGVAFGHAEHIKRQQGADSCSVCHHMNLPQDKSSQCSACHRQMYTTTDVFRHDWHASPTGANIACNMCHTPGEEKQKSSAKKCVDCHLDLYPENAVNTFESYLTVSYVDAMHGQCVTCHAERALSDTTKVAQARCPACHTGSLPHYLKEDMRDKLRQPGLSNVIIPKSDVNLELKQGE
ncbi:MAG: polysulfide reductase NrfD [candidate division Zixibacteria bacterium]|nr:polysulfide reductase NrfD [candidate division Zixibacteria bacterium]